jgi:alpha-galactosidase
MPVTKKIVCLGAGSLYFPHAIPDLLTREELAGSEIVLYDLDVEKAEIMAQMGRRLAAEAGTGYVVRAAADLADAVDGADFALSSIGGSGAEVTRGVYGSRYHAADLQIPAKYGIYQIVGDTCGPAGMMMGLRSTWAYLTICRELEKRCPSVILLNHSNPMAVLCRAMDKYTSITTIGICHGVQGGVHHAAGILELPAAELECLWIGTNHYYWLTRLLHKGCDVLPELMERVTTREPGTGQTMAARLSRIYGFQILYPQDDHIIEFYPFSTQYPSFEALPYDLYENAKAHGFDAAAAADALDPTAEVRAEFLKGYGEIVEKAHLPQTRGSGLLSEDIGGMISAIATGRRQVCIANVANNGAIPNLPAHANVEVEAVTDSLGVRPVHMGEAPLVLKGILEKRFVWQELVADAAVKGDRNLALQALLVDEQAIIPEKAEAMLDELLAASKDLLPQFCK